jgi:hypothetical protein
MRLVCSRVYSSASSWKDWRRLIPDGRASTSRPPEWKKEWMEPVGELYQKYKDCEKVQMEIDDMICGMQAFHDAAETTEKYSSSGAKLPADNSANGLSIGEVGIEDATESTCWVFAC